MSAELWTLPDRFPPARRDGFRAQVGAVRTLALVARLGVVRLAAQAGLTNPTLGRLLERLPVEVRPVYQAFASRPPTLETLGCEMAAMDDS